MMTISEKTIPSPLASTFALLPTRQIVGAMRAAANEMAARSRSSAVAEHLSAILNELDDLETLIDALPADAPSATVRSLPAPGHFGASV